MCTKKLWWKIDYDRNEFPWGGSIIDKMAWAMYVTVNRVFGIFGKEIQGPGLSPYRTMCNKVRSKQ